MTQVRLQPNGEQVAIMVDHGETGYRVGAIHRDDIPALGAAIVDWVNHGQYMDLAGKQRVTQYDHDDKPGIVVSPDTSAIFADGDSTPIAADRRVGPPPWLGAPVMYRSKTGDYWLAATVARTVHSSSPEALDRARTKQDRLFLVPLGLRDVDLVVLSSGGRSGEPSSTGTYVEHNIPYDQSGAPGTWCWPEDIQGGRP